MTNRRDFTYLTLTDFVYVRLKGIIWTCNGLIKGNNLDIDAAIELCNIYKEVEHRKPLVIDCKGVISVTDRSWDSLFKQINEQKREVIFINCSQLDEKIHTRYSEYCGNLGLTTTPDLQAITIFFDSIKLRIDGDKIKDVNNYIIKNIKEYIEDCFEENPGGEFKYLSSTPVKASGEYNASNLIEYPEKFYWICLRMADTVEEVIQRERPGSKTYPLCLLAVNLRSCPFAAAVSLLLNYPLETIDHIGPITKVLDINKPFYNPKFYEYIYIGDFTIGGTEIKLSQTYANVRQCKLNHAIVIGSLHPVSAYTGFTLNSLLLLDGTNSKAKYALS